MNDVKFHKQQREILQRFIIDNKDLEILESRISRFNIFEAVGMVRQEIKHSNFIQFLLNPSEKHQLGDLFLKKILIEVLTDSEDAPLDCVDIAVSNFTDAEVRREWRNIDLLIYSPSNAFVCVIENKVDSTEGVNQLSTYESVISREFPRSRKLFIFLTKEGSPASQPNWLPLSYEAIANGIEKICDERSSSLSADVHISMRHYVDLIRRHLMSESDIAELCRKIYKQHRQAIELIYEHRPDLRSDIEAFIVNLIQESSQTENIAQEPVDRQFIRFAPREWDDLSFQKTCDEWTQSRRILLFEIMNAPQSLSMHVVIGPGDIQTKEAIQRAIKPLDIAGHRKCKIQESGWSHVSVVPILTASDYEDGDLEGLQEKIKSFWRNYISGDVKVIREAISNSFKEEAN